ncbi:MAG: hypothetical protein JWL64_1618 [Frankiales bacterium]|nr:hypothetical protein [Frankiales bacterium]
MTAGPPGRAAAPGVVTVPLSRSPAYPVHAWAPVEVEPLRVAGGVRVLGAVSSPDPPAAPGGHLAQPASPRRYGLPVALAALLVLGVGSRVLRVHRAAGAARS